MIMHLGKVEFAWQYEGGIMDYVKIVSVSG